MCAFCAGCFWNCSGKPAAFCVAAVLMPRVSKRQPASHTPRATAKHSRMHHAYAPRSPTTDNTPPDSRFICQPQDSTFRKTYRRPSRVYDSPLKQQWNSVNRCATQDTIPPHAPIFKSLAASHTRDGVQSPGTAETHVGLRSVASECRMVFGQLSLIIYNSLVKAKQACTDP